MTSMESANMTWDFFKRVRDITRMKILVKASWRTRTRRCAWKTASTA